MLNFFPWRSTEP